MNLEKTRYLVVEGPIGVGKTTLTRKLAERLGAQTMLESPQDNPFLDRFYRDAGRYALPAQMHFLLHRTAQIRELMKVDLATTRVFSDYLLEKDQLFAQLTLEQDELALYRRLHFALQPGAPVPDLVIYLQAEPEVLIERIKKRGVASESGISEAYIHRLCESYSRFFYDYETAPLLIVNNERLNPIDDDDDFELLLTHMDTMRGKREFFNRGE
ncbi:MAG: deoxynucleoside kinase [Burkholderiaceae bacterium]